MSRAILQRLANVFARSVTLGAKLLLMLALARYLAPADVAQYGLMVATIAFSLLLTGMDFHAFTTRELLRGAESQTWVLKSQFSLGVLAHAAFAPVAVVSLFLSGVLPWTLALWFFSLLALEHFAQEVNRILITLSDQIFASLVIFLRMGAWGLIAICAMAVDEATRNLSFVLASWFCGVALACAVGYLRLARIAGGGTARPVDFRWIWKGVQVALPMLLGTLAIRAIVTLDRYWIDASLGTEYLAAYVLFMSLAVAMTTLMEAGVFSFAYPRMIELARSGNSVDFAALLRKTALEACLLTTAFSAIAVISIRPLLTWLDRPIYLQSVELFPWVIAAIAVQTVSMPAHHALYALGRDRQIIASQIVAAFAFVSLSTVLVAAHTTVAIPVAMLGAFAMVATWKWLAVHRTSRSWAKEIESNSAPLNRGRGQGQVLS